jgi:5-methylthioadenosine/S-adenosylhomocysteine deaminase
MLVRHAEPHQVPAPDPYATLVYATRPTDVRAVVVDGEVLVHDGRPTRWDPKELAIKAQQEAVALVARAGL